MVLIHRMKFIMTAQLNDRLCLLRLPEQDNETGESEGADGLPEAVQRGF